MYVDKSESVNGKEHTDGKNGKFDDWCNLASLSSFCLLDYNWRLHKGGMIKCKTKVQTIVS